VLQYDHPKHQANSVHQQGTSVAEVFTRWNWNDCIDVFVESASVSVVAPTLVDVADYNRQGQ